jgi:hypothetical protein
MKTSIFITTRFEGFHRWPTAPDAVAFLRDSHRHIFHVRLEKPVAHNDRDIEFILLKREVDREIARLQGECSEMVATWSCENWADVLGKEFQASRVEVSEDGENGAVWMSAK